MSDQSTVAPLSSGGAGTITIRLGLVIRGWRNHQEIPLRTLAKEIGVPTSTLQGIESGRMPDGETLVRVWAWLTGRDGSKRKRR